VGAGLASLAALVGVVLAGPAAAARPESHAAALSPILECSATHEGVTKSVFGYDNHGGGATVPVGPANAFSPGPMNRGQPVSFLNGTRINVFTVSYPSQAPHLSWTLGGRTVSTPGPPCETSPAASSLANWGPVGALVIVTLVLGSLLFWRTRRLRTRSA